MRVMLAFGIPSLPENGWGTGEEEKRLALDTYARGRAGGKEGLRIRHVEVLYPMFQMLLYLSPIDMNTGTREKKYRSLVGSEERVASPARLVETSHSVSAVAGLSAAPTVQSVSTELGIPFELARESIARPGTTSLLENEVARVRDGPDDYLISNMDIMMCKNITTDIAPFQGLRIFVLPVLLLPLHPGSEGSVGRTPDATIGMETFLE
ncbi:Golgi-body localisation protein domain [Striga asiatica]|uniref:Golgi-body localisation protein domain n=1 Tax=Striga asiatica TaxID=4170 RepID=A0A5A7QV37_STRAF|nr:Golgi-body localisation protein domain [Striga asiatica]